MGSILTTFFRALLPILAGIGIGKVADKTLADKLPEYPADGVAGGNVKKLIWTAVIFAVGAAVWALVSKKLRIRI